tara:strand:- start:4808 stop:5089 length:282 start_codon:yes stop_codon:yes gene_type:complete
MAKSNPGTIGGYSRSQLNKIILDAISAHGGGGGGAPDDAQYVVMAANGDLSAERILTAGRNVDVVDDGSTVTITGISSNGQASDILEQQVLGG